MISNICLSNLKYVKDKILPLPLPLLHFLFLYIFQCTFIFPHRILLHRPIFKIRITTVAYKM